jgi:hypothetical protein
MAKKKASRFRLIGRDAGTGRFLSLRAARGRKRRTAIVQRIGLRRS